MVLTARNRVFFRFIAVKYNRFHPTVIANEKWLIHAAWRSRNFHDFAVANSMNMSRTDFFDQQNYQQLLTRLDNITPEAPRQWGKMDVSQMLHHLNMAIGSGLGYYELPDKSNLFSRSIIPFLVLDVIQRFPKGAKAPATLRSEHSYDFKTEKERLKEILVSAYATKSDADWSRHTYFGRMTRKAWGKLIMIHCDHHFRQFGN